MPALYVFGRGFVELIVKFCQLLYLKEVDVQVGLASFFFLTLKNENGYLL